MEKPLDVLMVDGKPMNLPGPSVEVPLELITIKEHFPTRHSHEIDVIFAAILGSFFDKNSF
jgi:hypothetical protein